jgi:phospholipid/cholesterol/gamma-HCH transport system substrate-binding protein
MASRTTEQEARISHPTRAVARVAGLAALVAAAVLAALLLLGSGGNGHTYRLLFETGGQLVPGNQVQVGGQPVGTVDEITLTDDAMAQVEITVDEPLTEGATAMVRATSLSGIANRYVSLAPGPSNSPELEDGATIPADKTTSPVDLDQLFNTFDERTREGLQKVIQGSAGIYAGNAEQARKTYKYFAPSLQATQRLIAELTRDQQAFSEFLTSGSRVLGAVAQRRDDLSALTQNANAALGAIARENEALDRTLVALPPALRQANTTFTNLRAALDDLDPLVATSKVATRDLAPFLRDVRAVARKGTPVARNLALAVNRAGKTNDLAEAIRKLPAGRREASEGIPRAITAMDDSQPVIEFARPYTPDLLGVITKLGQVTAYYDANGHYARVMPAGSNLFSYNTATEELDPIPPANQFDAFPAFGLGPFTRCPGGATQPNAGWPAPTDHPFLDDGALSGDCDPTDVPPGP